jgi:phage shock protein C
MKKLYRSEDNKIVAGVLGGIGEYFDIDPIVIRVFFIFLAFATGIIPFILAYIICLFIIPRRLKSSHTHQQTSKE